MNSKYTVIIQGPLNKVSLDALEYYRTVGRVVISTWDDQDTSVLEDYNLSDVLVRFTELPEKVYFVGQANETFTYQVKGIRFGAQQLETPYMIRTRSDERWGNLQPLIDRFEQDTEKIVCGNIFFKRWNDLPLHFGDHLFVGKAKEIYEAYHNLEFNYAAFQGMHCAEMTAAKAFLGVKNKRCDKDGFSRVFDVIDINELKPFVASWVHGSTTYIDAFDNPEVIKNINEL